MSVWTVLRSIPGRIWHAPSNAAKAVERMTMDYLWKTFILKSLYGLAGIGATALLAAAQAHVAPATQVEGWIWGLVASALTGLAGVLKKLATQGA